MSGSRLADAPVCPPALGLGGKRTLAGVVDANALCRVLRRRQGMVICHRGAAMRGCRLAGHNAAQSGFEGCARLLARSQVASCLPWLLAALVVLLWATYPTWFYAGLGAAATSGHALT